MKLKELHDILYRLVLSKADRTKLYEWLKNLIDPTKLESIENRTEVVNSFSTHDKYPTAKAVYESLSQGVLSAAWGNITGTLANQKDLMLVLNALSAAIAEKQAIISDLETIRSGAAAGATAVQDASYVHTDNNYTTNEKNSVADITSIKNRIDIIEGKESNWDGKQDSISDLSTIRNGAAAGATALQSVPSTYRTAAAQDAIITELTNSINQSLTALGDRITALEACFENS